MMRQLKLTHSANDNMAISRGQVVTMPRSAAPVQPAEAVIVDNKKTSGLGWIFPILALVAAGYAAIAGVAAEQLIWPAGIIAGILALTAARAAPQSRLRNVSAMLVIGAITLGLTNFLALNGFALMTVEVLLLTSGVALLVGALFRSRPAAMLSSLSALAYLASLFPQLGLFEGFIEQLSYLGLAVIPVLLLGQAVLAQRLRSHIVLFVVLTAGYIWIIASAPDMSLSAMAGIGFALAAAQYCVGKAWAVRRVFGAELHIVFGALLALLTAFYIQSLWMSGDVDQAALSSPPDVFWQIICGVAVFIVFISSLVCYKASQISMIGIFAITLAVVLLPLATAQPEVAQKLFAYVHDLKASPGFGLVIGAAILAFGLNFIVDGLRTDQLANIVIGASAIGLEGILFFKPELLKPELVFIFIVSLIFALGASGFIAGATTEKPRRL